ncbi:Uncharacterised protein [Vibrio cholerae]|nr:Uncharacterised protein [Vibrio cholerae]CSB85416.1 Uncharacterised protein [Vibrio cholerae]CSB89585.1 Uncharacterised protein [Vibrio cholerae]CSC12568.1 Uncharacterised protein [Vibrio cholerae]
MFHCNCVEITVAVFDLCACISKLLQTGNVSIACGANGFAVFLWCVVRQHQHRIFHAVRVHITENHFVPIDFRQRITQRYRGGDAEVFTCALVIEIFACLSALLNGRGIFPTR